MNDKTICRTDGRCEYAIQSGAEENGHCPNGKCAMPASAPGTGSDSLDCILGVGGFASFGPLDAQPAAHLTIPGALEWDGDNGTHGADGESRADGESDYDDAKDACAEIERAGTPGDVIREMNDELVDLRAELDQSNVVRQLIQAWVGAHGRPIPWAKAIEITAVATKMPDDEKAALLSLDDEPAAQYTAVDMTTAAADGFRDGLAAFSADGNRNVLAEVFFQKGDDPFICAVRGRICVEQLEAAQRDFRENLPDELEQGEGIYTFSFYYDKGQYDGMGRCEIAPGWGFDFVSYAAFEAADEPPVEPFEPEAFDDIPDFTQGSGNKAKRRIAAIEAAKAESFPCWSCSKPVTMEERAAADGECPHCAAELDLEDWPKAKPAKPKTCIECDQPYCPGVCVERGDQDYDRDQAAKGGDDE